MTNTATLLPMPADQRVLEAFGISGVDTMQPEAG
jgi:hypothetical protein